MQTDLSRDAIAIDDADDFIIPQTTTSPGEEAAESVDSQTCCDEAWEEAYLRFETPEKEIEKFRKRLRWFGVEAWNKDLRIVELFCGRGNGLITLSQLGFTNLEGVDLSGDLLANFTGDARCTVADCRHLPHDDASVDVAIVQGGLHHLPELPGDLEQTLAEVHRVLAPRGRLLVVEPWRTPFLDVVHFAIRRPLLRAIYPRLDALAVMTEHEAETYFRWLSMPNEILDILTGGFQTERFQRRWGKLFYLGRKL